MSRKIFGKCGCKWIAGISRGYVHCPLGPNSLLLSCSLCCLFYSILSSVMATSKLPILVLPYPLILLPASRFTMPVSKVIGDTLSLIDESDALPIVAAIPTTSGLLNTDEELSLSE
jgi:hypothetical protein